MLTVYARLRRRARGTSAPRSASARSTTSTNRNIALGADHAPGVRRRRTGYHNVARLLGGYWFRYRDWNHGPVRQAHLGEDRRAPVQRERQRQHRAHLRPAEARRAAGRASAGRSPATSSGFRPFARATLGIQLRRRHAIRCTAKLEHARTARTRCRASSRTTTGGCSTLGVSRDFGRVTGFLSGNASASKGDGDYWAITVGIRVPL